MKKLIATLLAVMLMTVGLVAATPADTIKDGSITTVHNEMGAFHNFVSNAFGTFHCSLKPYSKNQPQGKGWFDFWNVGIFWAHCNAIGPRP